MSTVEEAAVSVEAPDLQQMAAASERSFPPTPAVLAALAVTARSNGERRQGGAR